MTAAEQGLVSCSAQMPEWTSHTNTVDRGTPAFSPSLPCYATFIAIRTARTRLPCVIYASGADSSATTTATFTTARTPKRQMVAAELLDLLLLSIASSRHTESWAIIAQQGSVARGNATRQGSEASGRYTQLPCNLLWKKAKTTSVRSLTPQPHGQSVGWW